MMVSYYSGNAEWKAVAEILLSVRVDPSVKASNMTFYPSFICLLLFLQIPVQTLSASSKRPSSGKEYPGTQLHRPVKKCIVSPRLWL